MDEGGGDQPIAADVLGDRVGEASASVVADGAVGIEVDVDAEPVAAGEVGDRIERSFRDVTYRVDPVDIGVAVVEQPIA